MGCFSGRLMSAAASDQKLFCKLCSPFCCSFNVFVEEKVITPSYSSAILTPPESLLSYWNSTSFLEPLPWPSTFRIVFPVMDFLCLLRIFIIKIFIFAEVKFIFCFIWLLTFSPYFLFSFFNRILLLLFWREVETRWPIRCVDILDCIGSAFSTSEFVCVCVCVCVCV